MTTPGRRASSARIVFHCNSLPPDEVTTLDGIPITTVPRTLLDLATLLDEHDLLTAVGEAEKRELGDPLSLPVLLERHRGERGTGLLRAALERVGYGVPIESLERHSRGSSPSGGYHPQSSTRTSGSRTASSRPIACGGSSG